MQGNKQESASDLEIPRTSDLTIHLRIMVRSNTLQCTLSNQRACWILADAVGRQSSSTIPLRVLARRYRMIGTFDVHEA